MKIKEKLKKNKRFLLGFLLGILISSGSVYAASIISKDVSYDNSSSKLTSTNVQGAIDELYKTATDKIAAAKEECPEGYICRQNFFETDSWSTIEKNVKNGLTIYQVGDTKEVDMGELGTHTVRVANTSECTNDETSETACGFVVEFADIITTHNMNSTRDNTGGWLESEMRTYLNNTLLNFLPSDLKNVISDTTVISGMGGEFAGSNINSSVDKLYLLSTSEIFNDCCQRDTTMSSSKITKQLDYYKFKNVSKSNYSNVIKKYNEVNNDWWLRSSDAIHVMYFYILSDGSIFEAGGGGDPSESYGVSPAFRIE